MTFKQKTCRMGKSTKPASAKWKPLMEGLEALKLENYRMLLTIDSSSSIAFSLQISPGDIAIVARFLDDPDTAIRKNAAWGLADAASKGIDMSSTIPALANALSSENGDILWPAEEALARAAEKGTDISVAVPALAKLLFSEDVLVHSSAVVALDNAAKMGTDISDAILGLTSILSSSNTIAWPNATGLLEITIVNMKTRDITLEALFNAYCGSDENTRSRITQIIVKAAQTSDHPLRVAITSAIMNFANTARFVYEAEQNSTLYQEMVGNLQRIISNIRNRETRSEIS